MLRRSVYAVAILVTVIVVGGATTLAYGMRLDGACTTDNDHPVTDSVQHIDQEWSWKKVGLVCRFEHTDGRVESWVVR